MAESPGLLDELADEGLLAEGLEELLGESGELGMSWREAWGELVGGLAGGGGVATAGLRFSAAGGLD